MKEQLEEGGFAAIWCWRSSVLCESEISELAILLFPSPVGTKVASVHNEGVVITMVDSNATIGGALRLENSWWRR